MQSYDQMARKRGTNVGISQRNTIKNYSYQSGVEKCNHKKRWEMVSDVLTDVIKMENVSG